MPNSVRPRETTLQWLSLVGIIWLQSISGTNTNFPAYSSQLKTALSMSQLQLNNLAFASDTGKLFGWISGIAATYLPLWLVLATGSAFGLIGYGLQYLSVAHQIPSLAYWQVFALSALAGNSICWINTVSYVVAVQNFPASRRQVAVGLSTSYQGLSAKLYADMASSLSSAPGRAKPYLLLNSVAPIAACLVSAPLARDLYGGSMTAKTSSMDAGFVVMFVITVATGIFSVVTSLEFSGIGSVVGTAVLLAAPMVVPAAAEKWLEKRVHSLDVESGGAVVKLEEDEENGDRCGGGVREEIGVWEMVRRVDFWLYFLVYFASVTVGLVFLNNLGQIAESRGRSRASSLVSLSSSFVFFGRLVPALLDYHFSRSKYSVSRPGMIAILVAPMAGAFFLLINSNDHSLYIATAIIGLCTGAITSISVSTTSELFGTENFSVNHNVLVANIPIGSFLFGNLAAIFYHREGNRLVDGKCMGIECYRTTFLIWGCTCLLGTVLALTLYLRTRKFYSHSHT